MRYGAMTKFFGGKTKNKQKNQFNFSLNIDKELTIRELILFPLVFIKNAG